MVTIPDIQRRDVLMAGLLRSQNVIDVKYVVTILVIEPIILHTLARFCENTARIS